MRRIARTADGWFPLFSPDVQGKETLERMRGYAREAGRDASTIGVEGRLSLTEGTPDTWAQEAQDWATLGATHLMINTMRAGLDGPDDHIKAIRQIKEAIDTMQ